MRLYCLKIIILILVIPLISCVTPTPIPTNTLVLPSATLPPPTEFSSPALPSELPSPPISKTSEVYPPPLTPTSEGAAYPEPTETAIMPLSPYPPSSKMSSFPTPTRWSESMDWRSFMIDTPVRSNMTKVTGQGPPRLSILVVDVHTRNFIGEGYISDDGLFSVELSQALKPEQLIGIMIKEDIAPDLREQILTYFEGEGARHNPIRGDVYVVTKVKEPN